MPLALVRTIVDEAASPAFVRSHAVTRFEVGENGDAFLNRDFIPILRYIRARRPDVQIEFFTNFQFFTPERAAIILEERLIDTVTCNIDGGTEADYQAVKRISYERVRTHVTAFLARRASLGTRVPLTMQILTADYYIRSVQEHLGTAPLRLIGTERYGQPHEPNVRAVRSAWEALLDPAQDRIVPPRSAFAWAERAAVDASTLDYSAYTCPLIARVTSEAFIAPDGTWYACCYDSNYELALGNVKDESLDAIFHGETRRRLIERLQRREFAAIGGPCATVNCCQSISPRSPLQKAGSAIASGLTQSVRSVLGVATRRAAGSS